MSNLMFCEKCQSGYLREDGHVCPNEPLLPVAGGQVERIVGCLCATLCYANEMDFATAKDKRHHPGCPLHKTQKYPRLFYYEEAEECWTPATNEVDCIISLESFMGHDDRMEIIFKR